MYLIYLFIYFLKEKSLLGKISIKLLKIKLFNSKKAPPVEQAVMPSKLVDGRCRVQSPVALVDLAVRSFLWFTPKFA